jgi:hypothetical protein
MPVKIVTDTPAQRAATATVSLNTGNAVIVEANYFSVPLEDGDADDAWVTPDPSDAEDRELRPGEVFISAPMLFCNTGGTARTVIVELVREGGAVVRLADLWVPGNDTRQMPAGLRLFKRNLASPNAAGDLLRARLTSGSGVNAIVTYVERQALEHAPNTEG